MKTSCLSLWLLFRDQDQQAQHRGEQGPASHPGTGGVLSRNVAAVLKDLMRSVRGYLTADHTETPGEETAVSQVYLNRVLIAHSTLSVLNEKLVVKGHQSNGIIGRIDEYRRALMLGFEQLRGLRQYQSSPVRMQRFCTIMVHLTPIILAPYWRHYCHDYNEKLGISPQRVCIPAYLSCTIFVSVLCTLLRVAVDIADPWDGVGADDIAFKVPEEIEWATRAAPMGFDEHGNVMFAWTQEDDTDDKGENDEPESPMRVQLRRMTSAIMGRAPADAQERDEEADALLSVHHRHSGAAAGTDGRGRAYIASAEDRVKVAEDMERRRKAAADGIS